ncbi:MULTISPECIES: cytochrome c3 family protein [Sphingomonadales]|jgi:hypothetical protein|uniref:Cytochrome C n=1 Tax=Novosphingobium soli TaxID=574956 RepID=A0ABV6CWB7_9SPHN|nr:cytochrome C [Sphingobium sp.]MBS88186.1 cytochrome C [Sphingobium sp.]
MTRGKLLYWLFLSASLALLVLAVATRSSAPAGAGPIARLVMPGPLSAAHQSFGAQCTSCHTPLKGVEDKSCISCHAGTDFGTKQSTQFHAQAKQCTSCHVEHEGDRGIVRMNHEALLDPKVWQAGPMSAPTNPLPMIPETALNCASCHSIRDPHLGLFGKDCASCHTTTSWQISNYRHPSVNSTQCSECHKAPPSHFMEHFSMVSQRAAGSKARVDQCFACHTTDSFNNIRRRGWYDHH